MSVIVGFKRDGKIWMAGDSRVSMGTHVEKLVDSTSKIWTENDMMIVGGVGLLSELQLMRYGHFIPQDEILLDHIDVEYLYSLYSYYGKAYLDHFGITLDTNTGYQSIIASSFMFGVNNHLMVLGNDGSVAEYDDFAVIGCAGDLVRGYIMGHKDEKDVEKLLRDAIKHAAAMDSGIDININVYCIKDPYAEFENIAAAMQGEEDTEPEPEVVKCEEKKPVKSKKKSKKSIRISSKNDSKICLK